MLFFDKNEIGEADGKVKFLSFSYNNSYVCFCVKNKISTKINCAKMVLSSLGDRKIFGVAS